MYRTTYVVLVVQARAHHLAPLLALLVRAVIQQASLAPQRPLQRLRLLLLGLCLPRPLLQLLRALLQPEHHN